jgi:hypothetical protein
MNCARSIRLRALLALCASALVGCESTGVGNPVTGEVQLSLVADEGATAPGDDAEALPRGAVEHAVLVLARIEWLPCDTSLEPIVEPGPFVVDLVTGLTSPEIPALEAPAGGVCGFDAPLGPARDSAELAGRSLFFSGVRADGVPFLLFSDMRATLSVRSSDGASWAIPKEKRRLLWEMNPRRWAPRADLDTSEPTLWGGGRQIIRIDVNRHPLLYALIRARLGSEGRLLDESSSADLGVVTSNED